MAGSLEATRTTGIDPDSQKRSVVGAKERLRRRGKQLKKRREKPSPEGQRRVDEKIAHLIETGEVPNTEEGRKKAAAMAYSMEKAHRLRRGGVYVPKGK